MDFALPNAFIYLQKNSQKNRIKLYNVSEQSNTSFCSFTKANLYLKNGDEFGIEFENITSEIYLAKIKINGKYVSNSGLILKPGERVFLDRYLDEPKKFKFETYMIENSDAAKTATINNGLIEIEFYKEEILPITNYITTFEYKPSTIYRDLYFKNNIPLDNFNDKNVPFYSQYTTNTANNIHTNTVTNHFSQDKKTVTADSVETGRVEKGSYSNQSFSYANYNFSNLYNLKISYKLLPVSQLEQKDLIRNYCNQCAFRIRKTNWVFCPKCGVKL